jgi:hypothetical protein
MIEIENFHVEALVHFMCDIYGFYHWILLHPGRSLSVPAITIGIISG